MPYSQNFVGYPVNSYTGAPSLYPSYFNQAAQSQSAAPAQNVQAPFEGVIWVQGEAGARAYPVQAGRMAVLMDSEDSMFYMKAVDIYGMPQPLRKFRFSEITGEQKNLPPVQASQSPEYITKDEFERILNEKLDELTK